MVVTICTLAMVLGLGLGEAPGMPPIDVGTRKQLFLGPWAADGRDDYLVESMENVTMMMNEAHVTGERLVECDKPWEGFDVYLAVLKDGDRFRMYYGSRRGVEAERRQDVNARIMLYAESRDGIHWEKPNLGLCSWEGSHDNNILFPNDDFPFVFSQATIDDVFIDPHAKSAAEKYKMFASFARPKDKDRPLLVHYEEHLAFSSADGVRWKLLSTERVHTGAGDAKYSVLWDERIGKYVQYSRIKPLAPEQTAYYRERFGLEGEGVNVRMVGRAESDDFIHWTKGQIVLAPDEVDRANSPPGLTRLDFYEGNVCKYSETPDAYIAMPNCHSHWKFVRAPDRLKSFPETLDVQLATSRDGIRWNRAPARRPFIRNGVAGTFWSKMIFPSSNIIRVGDELWVYFGASPISHNLDGPWSGSIGRAVLRLDGFLSADAAYTGGQLITRPLKAAGSKLQLNLATGAGGCAQVEIRDQNDQPIPGFTLADADEINGNHIRVLASWRAEPLGKLKRDKGSTDVSPLAGRTVRLRFVMRDAKLYSFQFLP